MNMNAQMNADYWRALSLNNAAVSLIEMGRHKQAACALKDSLKAMKMLFKKQRQSQSMQLSRKLEQARAWTQGMPVSAGDSNTLTYENNQIALEGQEQIHFGSIHPVLITVSHDPKFFVPTGRDPQLEMSIILNNFGIALFYVSSVDDPSGDERDRASIQDQSLKMMSLASSIMVERFAMCDDMENEARLMSVALLVTGNTMLICLRSGRVSDAKNHSNKYQRMCLAIRRYGVVAPTA